MSSRCGQLWEERYESTGHGEMASTRNVAAQDSQGVHEQGHQ
jgi:hypothetical protein